MGKVLKTNNFSTEFLTKNSFPQAVGNDVENPVMKI